MRKWQAGGGEDSGRSWRLKSPLSGSPSRSLEPLNPYKYNDYIKTESAVDGEASTSRHFSAMNSVSVVKAHNQILHGYGRPRRSRCNAMYVCCKIEEALPSVFFLAF